MAEPGFEVLFLIDRLVGPDDLLSLRGLLERLERVGHRSRVICRSATPDHGIAGLIECPGLGRRWLLPWVSRGLDLSEPKAQPRLLHVFGAEMAEAGLDVAERWRLPYLLTIDEFPRRDDRLRLSRSWCRGIVATNRELAEALNRDYGIPARLIQLVPRGISEPVGSSNPARSGRVPVVGAAGPLVPASGYGIFLNAARRVVDSGIDAEFLIAGEGDDEAELRRRAERLRIADRLTFAEGVTVGLTFWDALDVFCQTSVNPTTGRPLALAMAHGVPSVASDVEGLRTLVSDGTTGVRIPPGDASALARAIAGLLADPDRARSLGEAGRRATATNHHPDLEAERLAGLYQEIAAGGFESRESVEAVPAQEADPGCNREGGWTVAVPGIVPDA
jgi:glycosyltransferase involved in cell wall biosynthesis